MGPAASLFTGHWVFWCVTNGARVGAQTLEAAALAYCPPSPGCGCAQGRCLLSAPQSAARVGSVGGTQGPTLEGPNPVRSSVTTLLWNARWQINKREAASLCTHVERAPGYIFQSKISSYRTICEV